MNVKGKPKEEINIGRQESKCFIVFCWIIQIGAWAALIVAIIFLQRDKKIYFAYFAIYNLYHLFNYRILFKYI